MHFHTLDFYICGASPIHRLSPIVKFIAAITFVIVLALFPANDRWILFAIFTGILSLLTIISKLSLRLILTRLLVLELFTIGIALLALFQPDGGTVFLLLIIRSSLCIWTMLILTGTTSYSQLLEAMHTLKVPKILVTTLALMYRYLFVMVDEMTRMKHARASRTFTKYKDGNWVVFSSIVTQLFIRSSLRAERVFDAMSARGWKS